MLHHVYLFAAVKEATLRAADDDSIYAIGEYGRIVVPSHPHKVGIARVASICNAFRHGDEIQQTRSRPDIERSHVCAHRKRTVATVVCETTYGRRHSGASALSISRAISTFRFGM